MSGYLIQSRHGSRGNFELVAPWSHGDGLAHFWRNNDDSSLPWSGPSCFGSGRVVAAALIQSNYGSVGNLEVVANEGGRLVFYWRADGPPWGWSGPLQLNDAIRANPTLIQSRHGRRGNFELVVGHRDGGLIHMWRNNDDPSMPWGAPFRFGRGRIDGVAMIQSNYGSVGNLEVVANEGGRLAFYWRQDGPPWSWSGPYYLADNVRGTPALIQSRHGRRGNFEVVVGHRDGGLIHMWRNNDDPSMPWSAPFRFGAGTVDEASLIQSNFGAVGNLEVVTREAGDSRFYWRLDHAPWTFSGPFAVGTDRAWNWSECVYSGRAGYFQADTKVTVRIQLNPDSGISAATMNSLRTTWRNGIVDKWSNRFDCRAPNGQRRRIFFDVQWVTSNPHHTVRVQTGPARSNEFLWDTSDTGDVASHEFGHMLGNPDEYSDSACTSRSPVNTGTVMDDNTEAVSRLVEGIANFHCGHHSIARLSIVGKLSDAVSAVKLYEQLNDDDQKAFQAKLRMVADGTAAARQRKATRLQVAIEGGAPTERFAYVITVSADGAASVSMTDELHNVDPVRNQAKYEADQIGRIFEGAARGAFLALRETAMPIPPDALVATITISDGDAQKTIHVPVFERRDRKSVRAQLVDLPIAEGLMVPKQAAPEALLQALRGLRLVDERIGAPSRADA